MKKFIIQGVFLIIVIMVSLAIYAGKLPGIPFLPETPKVTTVTINDIQVKVEVADTASKRSKGLGGRDSLAADSGMLFIFDKQDKYSFWMKGVKFPLDMVWIRSNRVVDISKNAAPLPPDIQDKDIPIYMPTEPVDSVLEINAGFADTNNIKVGDLVAVQ